VDKTTGEWKSGITKHLSETEKKAITQRLNVEKGDLLFISADERKQSLTTLGRYLLSLMISIVIYSQVSWQDA